MLDEKDSVEKTSDADLRAFIFEQYADAEIDGRILVQNMETIFQWIRNGTVPEATKKAK